MISNIKLTSIPKNTRFKDKRGKRIKSIHVGQRCLIRNGKNMFFLFPKEFMVGDYFRDYRFTKIRGRTIHIKNKSKGKNKGKR